MSPSAGKELIAWLFTCVVFIFSVVSVVHVPFPFGVRGRVCNSIVSVPDHCLFIYFTFKRKEVFKDFRYCSAVTVWS